uniref:Uncharacterized protein n=1 Tax=Tetranychus urticae TaxID=32264 RepID=T1KG79_TETUR
MARTNDLANQPRRARIQIRKKRNRSSSSSSDSCQKSKRSRPDVEVFLPTTSASVTNQSQCVEVGMSISAMDALADKITDRLVEHFKREKIRKADAKLDFLRRQLNEN